jgi:hypothetical protein
MAFWFVVPAQPEIIRIPAKSMYVRTLCRIGIDLPLVGFHRNIGRHPSVENPIENGADIL